MLLFCTCPDEISRYDVRHNTQCGSSHWRRCSLQARARVSDCRPQLSSRKPGTRSSRRCETWSVAVAETILEIIGSGTPTLRHPVGPDPEGFLAWRGLLTDEQCADWGTLPDEAW
jgi:hypothetical protein